jgi:flagellar assembly factor FliW
MDFKSKLFGEQHIDPDTIITFPNGLPGFEAQKRYKLFHQEGSPIVFWLQCLDDPDVVFSVSSPVHFNLNYNFILTEAEQALLKLTNPEDILILIILHKDDHVNPGQPTVKGSIKAPILINSVQRIGIQKVFAEVEQSITLTEKNNSIEVTEL